MPTHSTTMAVVHAHQNDVKLYRPHPVQHLTEPASASDGPYVAASSTSTPRSTPRTPPPSTPLPPLPIQPSPSPLPAQRQTSTAGAPTQVSASPRKSTGKTLDATSTAMGAGVTHKTSVLHPAVSRPKLFGEGRRPEPLQTQIRIQNAGQEFGESVLPASPNRKQSRATDVGPATPGMLKRLATRIAGTRSSPSLRQSPATGTPGEGGISKPIDTLHTQHEQDEGQEAVPGPGPNPNSTPSLTLAASSPSMPDEKTGFPQPSQPPPNQPRAQAHPEECQNQSMGQSLNTRLSLAMRAEKERRAEKRVEKAREEQRATDARRAAALAQMGLLPASRRYSVVPVPANANGRGSPIDAFAKDGIERDRRSDDGVEVDSKERKEEREGALSAAEIVIQEWRERNKRANEASKSASPIDVPRCREESGEREGDEKQDATKPSVSSNREIFSVSDVDQETSSPALKTPRTPAKTPQLEHPKSNSIPSSPTQAVNTTDVSNQNSQIDAKLSTVASKQNGQSPLPLPPSKKKPCYATKDDNAREQDVKDVGTSANAKENERAAFGAWRFPAAAAAPKVPDSSGSTTPRGEKASESVRLTSPASPRSTSSASTAVASCGNPPPPCLEDAPPPLPPKLKKAKEKDEGESITEPRRAPDQAEAQSVQTLLRSTQLPDPTSFVPPASPDTPTEPSAGVRARPRPSTGPPASQAPTARLSSPRQHTAPPALPQAPSLCLPALSPTTSTSTSTDGGSALPRTPSTSSHGHSPPRILDAPLEDEEDALLLDSANTESIGLKKNPRVNVTGVREFGELANLAETDLDAFEVGALPPLPPSASQNSPAGNVAIPVGGEGDKRKRTTLFGRRRTTQNGPPMIAIPENVAGAAAAERVDGAGRNADKSGKPRHASSFTNLRRTVTSVTAGIVGATSAGMRSSTKVSSSVPPPSSFDNVTFPQKKASFPSRDHRPPPRAATMPTLGTGTLGSSHSNASGTSSSSPMSATFSTPNQRSGTGVGLRVQPLNPTMHSRGSILLEAHAIEDEESRRLSELAFLD